eukprot:6461524-Alexandrium_andersonii.AAC.1
MPEPTRPNMPIWYKRAPICTTRAERTRAKFMMAFGNALGAPPASDSMEHKCPSAIHRCRVADMSQALRSAAQPGAPPSKSLLRASAVAARPSSWCPAPA